MTLTRTIRRREKRKRAKTRRSRRSAFTIPQWVIEDTARRLRAELDAIDALAASAKRLPQVGTTITVRKPVRYRDDDPDLARRYD